jgi:RNA polymerase sigma-70 factor (ECF subfamily)
MSPERPAPTAAALIEHVDWMRALARCLVRDVADAEDLVQETYLAALASPPAGDRPARPWLSQVLRNALRTGLRRRTRRQRREHQAGQTVEAPPLAEEVLARTQLHRRIAGLMSDLPEPYRSALVLRFFEGRDSAEIGQMYGVAAGTIRWRINEGLRRLRAGLDESEGGSERWRAMLLPLATVPRASAPRLPEPVSSTRVTLMLLTLAAGGIPGWLCLRSAGQHPAPVASFQPRPSGATKTETQKKENTMSPESMKRLGALVGTALPILLANADVRADAALVEEGVNWCVEMREKVFECKEAFADANPMISNAPADKRQALRAKFLEEITADGSGPLSPRQEKCRAMSGKLATANPDEARAKLDGMKKLLAFCAAKEDCAARVECMSPFLKPGGGKKATPKR